ncbi:MAG TPA: hypothetical protein PK184_20610 [Phycisphaerae bacterium]|nr:hypothetical protein [Phycisphaerae bacterium]HPP29233.1 hypothetical protein [Phycisphaerae bacterium]HPU35104.1 hypothetical protein [Phycisphaerae bacterium]
MVELYVPSADGGEEEGLNDPGVEFFLGDVEHHLAREVAQNVIDVPRTGVQTVHLDFELIDLPKAQLPCVHELAERFERCRAFWQPDRTSDKKVSRFFTNGLDLLQRPTVKVLRISDYGTTGLTGNDTDRTGRWYALVRSAGVSNKDEGAGGSYGIGKYAPFAASEIRTVFYSTRTEDGEVAFQGVVRLASHKDRNERTTRRTGYIGRCNHETHSCAAIRDITSIPEAFVRRDPGTDIFVIGYRAPDGWERNLLSSILTNFWPAIHRNIITFRVGDRVVDGTTLAADLDEFAQDKDFTAHLYYKALREGQRHETSINSLGTVALYLTASDEELPKRVALTRKTGMIINLKAFRSRRPFCGYFVCDDPAGNELLRSLEPPRHDEWNPKRGSPEAARALRELYEWIRGRIRDLSPAPTTQALDVPDLARYLPYYDDAEELAEGNNSGSATEQEVQFTPLPRTGVIEVRPAAEPRPVVLEASNVGGETDIQDGGGRGEGGTGAVSGTNNGDNGAGASAGGGHGTHPSRTPASKPELRLRSFRRNDGTYELVVRSLSGDAEGFRLVAVGEDGRTEVPVLTSAQDANTMAALPVNGPSIEVPISAQQPARVVVQLGTPLRLALAAEAI